MQPFYFCDVIADKAHTSGLGLPPDMSICLVYMQQYGR